MAYYLGVDIGTTYTAAAVWRDGRVEIASLGNRAPVIPSVVFLRDDATMLIGEAAARRGAAEPQRVTREFKRRIGDPTPIIIGGTPYSADALISKVLAWVVAKVSESEGGAPDSVTVTHPANWGAFKKDLLRQAIRRADLEDFRMVTEPEAAAIHYASQERIEPGAVIAVYDLGGGTFDVALLRKQVAGWDILGEPEGIERLGGVDFDEAVFQHVVSAAGGALDDLDPDDGATLAAVARLRQECIEAKEALSSDSDVTIPVLLPALQTEVRLTRAEFEGMIRPTLADSISAINRALRSAKVEPDVVTAVLLVGGSSRIPLVAELVSSQLARPVAVDAHPKYGIALGAAILAADHASSGTAVTTEVRVVPEHHAPAAATAASAAASTDTNGGAAPSLGPAAATAAALAAGAAGGAVAGTAAAAVATPQASAPTPPPAPAPTPPPPAPAPPAPPAPAPMPAAPPAPAPTPAPPVPPGPPTAPGGPPTFDPPAGASTQPWPNSGGGPSGGAPAASTTSSQQLHVPAPSAGGTPPTSGGYGGSGGSSGFGSIGGGAAGGGGPKLKPILIGVGAVVLLIAALAFVLTLGGDDDPETTAGGDTTAGTAATTTPTTAPQQTTSTTAPATDPFVQLDSVGLQGDKYLVNFTVAGFTPSMDAGSYHSHFYLDDIEADNAGANGNPVGDWDLTAETGSYLTKYGPADLSSRDAEQMCSLVADSGHNVAFPGTTTGNCVPLPPAG
jgi:actin-like ATPase involved in cell morphogenesis